MRFLFLTATAAIFPIVWGWAMQQLLKKAWPITHKELKKRPKETNLVPPPMDYQI